MKRVIDIENLDNLEFLRDWVEAFVEYHYGDPETYEEDGQTYECDWTRLNRCLADLDKVLNSKQYRERKPKEVKIFDTDCKEFKDWMYTAERRGRESVNPGWRYCVIDANLYSDLGVTDDLGDAMVEAASLSRKGQMYYVLRIEQVSDGTYKTVTEGTCEDGHFYERNSKEAWLHYDYIAQNRKIYKIKSR